MKQFTHIIPTIIVKGVVQPVMQQNVTGHPDALPGIQLYNWIAILYNCCIQPLNHSHIQQANRSHILMSIVKSRRGYSYLT